MTIDDLVYNCGKLFESCIGDLNRAIREQKENSVPDQWNCPKCGHSCDQPVVQYHHSRWPRDCTDSNEEHLHYRCPRCAYGWLGPTVEQQKQAEKDAAAARECANAIRAAYGEDGRVAVTALAESDTPT